MKQEPLRRIADSGGRFQPLWGAAVELEVEQPQEDRAAAAAEEAYRKGYEDGLASAEASFSELIQRERRSIEAELQRSLEVRYLAAMEALSTSVAEEISTAGAQIGDALARAVFPFAAEQASKLEYDELSRIVSRVVDIKGVVEVIVEGPERFAQGLAVLLEARGLKVVRNNRDDADLVVKVEDAELRSALPQWISRLEDILK